MASITSVICDSVLRPKLNNFLARIVQLVVQVSRKKNVPNSRPTGAIFFEVKYLLLIISFVRKTKKERAPPPPPHLS